MKFDVHEENLLWKIDKINKKDNKVQGNKDRKRNKEYLCFRGESNLAIEIIVALCLLLSHFSSVLKLTGFVKNGMLSDDIKDLFVKSEKNANIGYKLINLLLKM